MKKLKNMSEEEIAEQASLVTKEVKEFSRTLDFDNFDKAKSRVILWDISCITLSFCGSSIFNKYIGSKLHTLSFIYSDSAKLNIISNSLNIFSRS